MMERTLLYSFHGHKIKAGVEAPPDKFQDVFQSKYGNVRIFKILNISEESKAWAADPKNRVCDVPGSWYCPGQYQPGLNSILATKKDSQQLGDFNYKGEKDDEYTRSYFRDLQDPTSAQRKALEREARESRKQGASPLEDEEQQKKRVDEIYNKWEDTEDTTLMWKLISSNAVDELKSWLEAEPQKAFVRSRDGRGPMWWAFEQRNDDMTKILMKAGVPHTDRDANGYTPVD